MARKNSHFQQGSLFKRGKSRPVWVGRWWEDMMAADGTLTRVRRSEILGLVRDFPRNRDAERLLSERLRRVNSNNYSVHTAKKFADFVRQDWQDVVLPTMKYASQKFYRSILHVHLLPAFGQLPLREISREKIQSFLNAKLAAGLAWETVHHLQSALSRVLNSALEWGYVEQNPVRLTKLPRRQRKTPKTVLTPKQLCALLAVLREPSRSLVFLLAVTGIRIGELLALRWRKVDLEQGFVRIEETVYDGHFDTPKSSHSVRVVPLGLHAITLLSASRRQTLGDASSLVFQSVTGKPLDRRTLLARQLKPAAAKAGLSGITWHSLRHTNATLHDSLGTPLGTVQALLGHSSSEITRQVYLHSMSEDRRQAVDRLEAALFGVGPKLDPNPSLPLLLKMQAVELQEEVGRDGRI